MQVYKVFFKVINQQKFSIILYIIVFSALILLFGQLGNNEGETNFEEYKYSIVIFDEDQSTASAALMNYLGEWSNIKDYGNDLQEIQDALYARNISAAITIPAGFEENLQSQSPNMKVDMMSIPGTIYEQIMTVRINKYMKPLQAYTQSGMNIEDAVQAADTTVAISGKVSLLKEGSTGEYPAVYFFFMYMPYILITVFAVGVGPAVMVFSEKQIASRTLVSAYPFVKKNIELVLGMLTAGAVFCIFLFGIAALVYRGDFLQSRGILFCINALSIAMTSMSITYLITSFAADRNILNMAGNVIGLAFSFIGGIFVPFDIMPKAMQAIAKFVPVYWFAVANKGIMCKEVTLSNIGGYVLIQLGFSIALVTISFAVQKARRV